MQFHPRIGNRETLTVLRRFAICALCFAACAARGQTPAADDVVRVRAEAETPGTDASSRNAAARNAEHKALLDVIESAVGTQWTPVVAPLLDAPGTYVEQTRMLECVQSGGVSKVKVESFVRKTALLTDAAALIVRQMPFPPIVLVVTAEQPSQYSPFSVSPDGTAHRKLCELLRESHLDTDNGTALAKRYSEEELIARVQGGLDVASRFAQEQPSDIVLLGEARCTSEPIPAGTPVFRNTASVTVRLFRPRDGKMLGVSAQESVVHSAVAAEGAAQAIQDSCVKLRREMALAALLGAIAAEPTTDILLDVTAPRGRGRFDEILGRMAAHPGVEEVEELFYADEAARARIKYAGPMAPIVDDMTLRPYSDFSAEAERVIGRDITLSVTPQASSTSP